MALTPEQQAEVDVDEAKAEGRREHELVMETRRNRMEMLRMARDTLTENRRDEPTGSRSITEGDIITFTTTLLAYVDS